MSRTSGVVGRLGGAGRTLGARRNIGAGLLDQVVMATANAGNTLLALTLLRPQRAGVMVLSLGLGYLVIGVSRAFVGDVLLALASRYDGERRARLVRNGLTTALTVGGVAGLIFIGVWAAWPESSRIDLRDLIWIAPFLPVLLLHDTGRYINLADRRPDRALAMDVVWVTTQGVIVLAEIVLHFADARGLLVAWGLGAVAGSAFFLVRTGAKPLRGRPREWVAETRHLAGWFTAFGVIGQLHTQAVGFLVTGRLSSTELAGLRGAQTGLLQPMQNFVTAVQGLLVPRVSRLAGEAQRPPGNTAADAGAADAAAAEQRTAAAAAFRRQIRLVVLAFVGLAVVTVLVAAPVAYYVLSHIKKYAFAAPVALPMSMQAGLYLIQVPFTAGLRGLHQGRTLVIQYAVFAVVSLTGLFIGASADRLVGAVWGLLAGSAIGVAVMIVLYLRAAKALTQQADEARPGA